MKTRTAAVGLLLLVSAACGGAEPTEPAGGGTSSNAPSTSPSAQVTRSLGDATSTLAPPTSTTTTTTIVRDGTPVPLDIARLDNGLPATFVGVTADGRAVEVDAATGAIVATIAVGADPAQAEDEAPLDAIVQQVWRTADGEIFIVSECCEPAAGSLAYVPPGQTLTTDNRSDFKWDMAWTAAPSPFDSRIARAGLWIDVGEAGEKRIAAVDLTASEEPRYASSVVAWHRSGGSVAWVANNPGPAGGATLHHLDLSDAAAGVGETALGWVGPDQWLDGTGTQESGNFVAFLNTRNHDAEVPATIATEGVVFSSVGELVATFPVETGSFWGGYDPSGKVLIYTDADDVVRWQGLGQSGVLAEGFIHASW